MNVEDIYEIISPYEAHDDFYILGSIPERKLKNAWKAYPLLQDDQVIALIDTTLFGSAKNGMLIGLKGISFKNDLDHGTCLSWKELANRAQFKKKFLGGIALTDDHEFDISGSNMKAEVLIKILSGMLTLSRGEIVTSHIKHTDIHSNTDEEAVFNDIRIIKYIKEDGWPYFLVSIDDDVYISSANIFCEYPEDIEILCDLIDDESEIEIIIKLLKSKDIDNYSTITNMSYLFSWGSDHEHWDDDIIIPHPVLSKIVGVRLDTSNVTHMNSMFDGCTSLKHVDINTANVQFMGSMFQNCTSLKHVDINTVNVTNMASMFSNCISLEKTPKLDTSNVTVMENMFDGCTSLKYVDINTANVSFICYIFANCISLEKISKLDTSNSKVSIYGLFENCKKLTHLRAKFNLESLVESVLDGDDGWRKKEIKDKIKGLKKEEVNLAILMYCLASYEVLKGCSSFVAHPVLSLHLSDDMWFTFAVDSSAPIAPKSALDDLLS